ncbi:UvrD-helicase domain-containing protein [Clostridium bornimense]|uniref:UvrD-helicase domain-containing protein n=1 Tax=Clostridium bornimense TaxID=1216932 RepID=UPI001C10FE93|nr:UvrD-helicase domain-containing protein [Clostridium bornimense]
MNYTIEQQSIANYGEDELLVRGVAGSGKTISLLANAIKKCKESKTILFITFNKALNQKIENLVEDSIRSNIEIKSFHSWAYAEVSKILGRPNKPLWDNEKKKLIKQIVDNMGRDYDNRFIDDSNENLEFLCEEFNFIKGKNLRSLSDYMNVERIGRGTKVRLMPNSIDREVIYNIYEKFEKSKKYACKFEFIDLGFSLYPRIEDVSKYDYVYIDEAQDLNQVELQLLRKIAKRGFYVCADDGQKIYRTNYTWAEVGANFKGGRAKRLNKSFRSTYEIFKFASELQKKDTSLRGENYIEPEFDKTMKGAKPTLIDCSNSILRDAELIKRINSYQTNNIDGKIGILCKNRNTAREVQGVLNRAGIDAFLQTGSEKINFEMDIIITTLHSSKGLEFDYVIIPEFTEDDSMYRDSKDEDYWNNQRKLWYVAFTRARNKLDVMYFKDKNSLLQEIDSELYIEIKLN